MFLDPTTCDSTSDIHTPFDPDYLTAAIGTLEDIVGARRQWLAYRERENA